MLIEKKSILLAVIASCVTALCLTSCAPTYPKEKLSEFVKEVCKNEYDMDVDVAVDGSTLGVYYPMNGLLDVGMGISDESWDLISNLILVASRVVLSTDADIKFYCVITQDERLPEMQVILIKYTEDVKRGMFRYIGRSESFRRTLFSINLTPQARKERSVERIFDKLGLEEETRENVLSEFFRSPPSELSDIGYWRGHFYLKDIKLSEFIAAQIANRIKLGFQSDDELKEQYKYGASEGKYFETEEEKVLMVSFKVFNRVKTDEEKDAQEKKIEKIIGIANEVITGYEFKQFDFLELDDQLRNVKLWISSSDVYNFRKDKLKVTDITKTSGEYF